MNTFQKNTDYVNIPPFLHNRLTADHQIDKINGEIDKWYTLTADMQHNQLCSVLNCFTSLSLYLKDSIAHFTYKDHLQQ
jgi:hypothetical protein